MQNGQTILQFLFQLKNLLFGLFLLGLLFLCGDFLLGGSLFLGGFFLTRRFLCLALLFRLFRLLRFALRLFGIPFCLLCFF